MDSTQVVGWVSTIFQAYSAQIALLSLIVAGISLFFNYRQVKAGEASAKAAETSAYTAEKAVGEGFRPYVIVKMYSLDLSLDIEIVNIGNRPAKDIEIDVNPNFSDLESIQFTKGVINSINRMFKHKYLAPNQPVKNSLLFNPDYLNIYDNLLNDIRTFTIKYKSLENENYELEYQIDIRDFLIREKIAEISNKSLVKDIEKQLIDLNKNLKNLNNIVTNKKT